MTISVVIPTRNRAASLARTLAALERQRRMPDEVLIADASDHPADEAALRSDHPALAITVLPMPAGLCAQRNAAVRKARGTHVLLCDDDIEAPPDYLERLEAHLRDNPGTGAVSGFVSERDRDGSFTNGFAAPSLRHLLFATAFQLTVATDVEAARADRAGRRWRPSSGGIAAAATAGRSPGGRW